MNISTYEARIAALEAQLGPGPGTAKGILSVVVTPDINLNNGSTLNAALAEMMPVTETGDGYSVMVPAGTLGQSYSITLEVSSDKYAGAFYYDESAGGRQEIFAENMGEPLTVQVQTEGTNAKNLSFSVSATNDNDDEIMLNVAVNEMPS